MYTYFVSFWQPADDPGKWIPNDTTVEINRRVKGATGIEQLRRAVFEKFRPPPGMTLLVESLRPGDIRIQHFMPLMMEEGDEYA